MSERIASPPRTDAGREERILGIIETSRAKRPRFKDTQVTMAHGAGGKATQTLIEGLLAPAFGMDELADAGAVEVDGVQLVTTTDSFVVKPIRFPGGSIGELAVNGTVNDLAVSGAKPVSLTLSLILEEGLDADELRAEVEAIAAAAEAAGVRVVSGDTKVVERGACDSMYINTAGIGRVDPRASLTTRGIEPGDRVLLSSTIGEHGTAIMLARGELGLESEIVSDTRSVWPAVDAMLEAAGEGIRCMRDATRGGVASVLNELARASGVSIAVREADVPVLPEVTAPPSFSASIRCTWPTRAPSSPSSRQRRPMRRSRHCGASRASSAPPRSARSRPSPPGWCWWRPPSAAGGSWTCWPEIPSRGSAEK